MPFRVFRNGTESVPYSVKYAWTFRIDLRVISSPGQWTSTAPGRHALALCQRRARNQINCQRATAPGYYQRTVIIHISEFVSRPGRNIFPELRRAEPAKVPQVVSLKAFPAIENNDKLASKDKLEGANLWIRRAVGPSCREGLLCLNPLERLLPRGTIVPQPAGKTLGLSLNPHALVRSGRRDLPFPAPLASRTLQADEKCRLATCPT